MKNKDITSGHPVRQQLSEDELRLLFENMISQFSYYRMVYDAEGNAVDYIILAVNKAFELETGLKREEVIGKNVMSIYPETERYWIDCFDRVVKTGVSEQISQYSGALKKWFTALAYCPKPDHVAITITDISEYVTEREERRKTANELKRQQEENDWLAHVESITGLPNRICLYDAFAARVERKDAEPFFLAIFGPDNLAEVLASYGSVLSDRVMRAISSRLRAIRKDSDMLFSMTGTELVLLCELDCEIQQTRALLLEYLNAIREPVDDEGTRFHISASCGVACYPQDGTNRDDLIMKANLALYQAKKSGRQIVFFDDQIGQSLLRRTRIRNALPKALPNREFELFFQPQFDLETGRITGAEALLRWHSPELGEVPPIDCIGIAEESWMILPLGAWVLKTACETMKRIEMELQLPIRMAVNVSGVQLIQEGFAEHVTSQLQLFNIAPERLELEITESVVLNHESEAIEKLNRLSAYGVRIALDDFGTGYSSLSLLKDLKVATIKIDRAFIQDPSALVINESMSRLGHALGAEVVAEGVETREQMEQVRRIGCDTAQGYLLSVPLPADALLRLLQTQVDSGRPSSAGSF
ncbi:MAG: EAL domain-containing protein [Eubacteriales bacterium]|nr:EAL domain-containing protein [Eubacteriales bacterium]